MNAHTRLPALCWRRYKNGERSWACCRGFCAVFPTIATKARRDSENVQSLLQVDWLLDSPSVDAPVVSQVGHWTDNGQLSNVWCFVSPPEFTTRWYWNSWSCETTPGATVQRQDDHSLAQLFLTSTNLKSSTSVRTRLKKWNRRGVCFWDARLQVGQRGNNSLSH